ncbi:MAG: hypothetical protein ACTSR8_12305 [Promethearchaeota archaeon]
MDLRRKYGFALLFLLASLYFSIPFILADSYTLGIQDGDDIIWEITEVNETLLVQLETDENYNFDDNVEEGLQIKWALDEIDSYSGVDTDYWDISYYYSEGDDLKDNKTEGNYFYIYVAEDPVVLAEDWFDGDDNYQYSIVIIPVKVEDYLKEFTGEDTSGVYTSDGHVLIINNTVEGHHDTIIIEYNEDGIEETYQVYYDDNLAYEYELLGVYRDNENISFMIIIIVIIIIAVFAGIIVLVVIAKHNIKKRPQPPVNIMRMPPEDQNTQLIPPSRPIENIVRVIGYCEYCGSERDSDAVFCPGCGQKFENK